MKKIKFLLLAITVVLVFGLCACTNNDTETPNNTKTNTNSNTNTNTNDVVVTGSGRKLVVFYSATSHTKRVAEEIATEVDADMFEIVPVDIYTDEDLDWTNSDSRTSKEHKDASLRNVEINPVEIPDWEEYDTVFIGYPIWFGVAAWPTNSFVKAVDFGDKTVIPFCTSHSSGIGQSAKELQKDATGGNWTNGKRFQQDVDLSEVDSWVATLATGNSEEEPEEGMSRQMPPEFDGNMPAEF